MVGTTKLSLGRTRYTAKDTIVHEQYDEPLNANDIGLIRVTDSIEFNAKVQPVKYSRKEVGSGEKLKIYGWGRLFVRIFLYFVYVIGDCLVLICINTIKCTPFK